MKVGARLLAPDALLKGATISAGNRALLKQKGAEDASDEQLLHKAAQEGNIEIIQMLIQSKANLETKDEAGHTPLYKGCREWTHRNGASPDQ